MNLEVYATFGANKIEATGTFEYLDQYLHSEQKLIAYFCDPTKIGNNNFVRLERVPSIGSTDFSSL